MNAAKLAYFVGKSPADLLSSKSQRMQGDERKTYSPSQPNFPPQPGRECVRHREQAMETLNFSARACDHILKVARTLADLEGNENIAQKTILASHFIPFVRSKSISLSAPKPRSAPTN